MAIGKVIKGEVGSDSSVSSDRLSASEPRRRGAVVNAEVFEAHQEAQGIVEAAQRRKLEILEEARIQRAEIFAEAEKTGRQEGLKKVTEEFARAHMQRGEMLAKAEPELLKLALKIAEKIIGRDLERDPTLLTQMVATAAETVRNASSMVIRVNPSTASMLRERRKQMMEMIGRVKDISIKEDPDVEAEGCIIETDSGVIDAQLSTQLEMLLHLLVPDTSRREPR